MSSAERPEADVAEQGRDAVPDPVDEPITPGELGNDLDAAIADVLDQMQEAGLPDEDEAPYAG